MGLFLKLSLRNVQRYIQSSLLNGTGIAFCVIVVLFIFSLSKGIESQIVSRTIKFETGAVTVDFKKKIAGLQNKSEGDSLFNRIITTLNENKAINHYSFRIYPSNTILYFGENTQRISIIGISEDEYSLIDEMLKITAGDSQLSADEKTILISSGLAELLGLKVGDDCNLMLQSIDGTINLDDFSVKGVFRYTSQMNKFSVYMNYNQAKQLYNCNLPSQIIIDLKQLDEADRIKQELSKQFQNQSVEVTSYGNHIGMAKTLSGFNKYGMSSIAFFLVLISFVGIWSMQVENIHKRQREIGSLLSFGFSRPAVKKIFLYESLIISILFFIVGFIVVYGSILWINSRDGIYLGDSASFAFGSAIVNPILMAKDVFITFFMVLIYPFIATAISLNLINKTNIIQLLKN